MAAVISGVVTSSAFTTTWAEFFSPGNAAVMRL